MDHGQEIEPLAIGMNVIREQVLNVGQPRHLSRRDGIGQHPHRLPGGNQRDRPARLRPGLGGNRFPQRQVGGEAVAPGGCRARIAVDHRAGPGFQAGPGFGQENPRIRIPSHGQRRIIRCPISGGSSLDMGGQWHRLGQHQRADIALGQARPRVYAIGLRTMIPIPGNRGTIDDLVFDRCGLPQPLQGGFGQKWQIGAEQAVPDKKDIRRQGQQPHRTHPLCQPETPEHDSGQTMALPVARAGRMPPVPEGLCTGNTSGICARQHAKGRRCICGSGPNNARMSNVSD